MKEKHKRHEGPDPLAPLLLSLFSLSLFSLSFSLSSLLMDVGLINVTYRKTLISEKTEEKTGKKQEKKEEEEEEEAG